MTRIFLGVLALTAILADAQTPLHTIKLSSQVIAAYVDRPGDLYLEFKSGAIRKYDINGKLVKEYNPDEKLTVFDPRDGARAFSYNKSSGWYSYAFFGNLNKIKIRGEYAIDPVLVCASGDTNIWIFDQSDYSLKKINSVQRTVDVEVLLPEQLHSIKPADITMREYQRFLFLLDNQSGIYIFNSLGQLLQKREGKNIHYFNFLGEELYYPHQGQLVFYDLFDTKTREIPLDPNVAFLLMTDTRIYKVYSDRAEIHSVNP